MSSLAAARPARARLGRWPHDDGVVHLVLLDHHMVPNDIDVDGWIDEARDRGARLVRTGALFPNATAPFHGAGFHVADTLTLLSRAIGTLDAPGGRARRSRTGDSQVRLRRLRPSMLGEAAEIDRRSFSSPWANDTAALAEIMAATPFHRSRSIHLRGDMVAFSISGRADRFGYVQRLAVDPSARRRGFAQLLLDDALQWMRRRTVSEAMVNTATGNRPALALYEAAGFERQPGSLLILERALR
ncbi:MAG TPA: GNAT family N-acetyltransferase [Ilumatobacteraceae bacterium]|nr:GNAT family N-acetyltransferase [Ilumatobacteraceae bacterium]